MPALVRIRTRDHAVVTGLACGCDPPAPTIRVFGRTDDILIVKGINVFPSAIRDVVSSLEPRTTGNLKVALIVREGASHNDVKGRRP